PVASILTCVPPTSITNTFTQWSPISPKQRLTNYCNLNRRTQRKQRKRNTKLSTISASSCSIVLRTSELANSIPGTGAHGGSRGNEIRSSLLSPLPPVQSPYEP